MSIPTRRLYQKGAYLCVLSQDNSGTLLICQASTVVTTASSSIPIVWLKEIDRAGFFRPSFKDNIPVSTIVGEVKVIKREKDLVEVHQSEIPRLEKLTYNVWSRNKAKNTLEYDSPAPEKEGDSVQLGTPENVYLDCIKENCTYENDELEPLIVEIISPPMIKQVMDSEVNIVEKNMFIAFECLDHMNLFNALATDKPHSVQQILMMTKPMITSGKSDYFTSSDLEKATYESKCSLIVDILDEILNRISVNSIYERNEPRSPRTYMRKRNSLQKNLKLSHKINHGKGVVKAPHQKQMTHLTNQNQKVESVPVISKAVKVKFLDALYFHDIVDVRKVENDVAERFSVHSHSEDPLYTMPVQGSSANLEIFDEGFSSCELSFINNPMYTERLDEENVKIHGKMVLSVPVPKKIIRDLEQQKGIAYVLSLPVSPNLFVASAPGTAPSPSEHEHGDAGWGRLYRDLKKRSFVDRGDTNDNPPRKKMAVKNPTIKVKNLDVLHVHDIVDTERVFMDHKLDQHHEKHTGMKRRKDIKGKHTLYDWMASGNSLKGKAKRCKTCVACLNKNCGTCQQCLDMPMFGGSGRLKKGCIQRVCLNMVSARSTKL